MKRTAYIFTAVMGAFVLAAFSCDDGSYGDINKIFCPKGGYAVANIESWECHGTTTTETSTSTTTTTSTSLPSTTTTVPLVSSTTTTVTTEPERIVSTTAPSAKISSTSIVQTQVDPVTDVATVKVTG